MRLSRTIDIKIELKRRISDLYASAKCFHYTSDQLNEAYLALFSKYPKLPQWIHAYAEGLRDSYTDGLYRDHLRHGYEYEGVIYTNWDSSPEPLKDKLRSAPIEEIKHGHYWTDTLETRENKPFFLSRS